MDRPQRTVLSFAGLFFIRMVDPSSGLPDFFSLPDFFRVLEGVHPSSSLTPLPGRRGASRCLEASQRLSGLENGFSNFFSFLLSPDHFQRIFVSAYFSPSHTRPGSNVFTRRRSPLTPIHVYAVHGFSTTHVFLHLNVHSEL